MTKNGRAGNYNFVTKRGGKDMLASLDLPGSLAVDVILPGLYIGVMSWEEVSPPWWSSIINRCIKQVAD